MRFDESLTLSRALISVALLILIVFSSFIFELASARAAPRTARRLLAFVFDLILFGYAMSPLPALIFIESASKIDELRLIEFLDTMSVSASALPPPSAPEKADILFWESIFPVELILISPRSFSRREPSLNTTSDLI